ncbi:hypothetical protein TSTA_022510 [Talaromyces stipitatus ATCC 10500]|uniref:Uncharacterized protein n=1 Tax=Talaromyces stipitatus (strain ATCC 10500 / CBS 375.48 / QM 6759 / NRRL 1006) TaxID=441959 RepID=B8MI35_TALSN|nr:uncharacterized protein TSTA_022510 [Talaromyces stipitatus ATCC 10500]EED17197.1 hypothetical protein TSTA_022510 [Talaromyces stipitatus ATCC 10500]
MQACLETWSDRRYKKEKTRLRPEPLALDSRGLEEYCMDRRDINLKLSYQLTQPSHLSSYSILASYLSHQITQTQMARTKVSARRIVKRGSFKTLPGGPRPVSKAFLF